MKILVVDDSEGMRLMLEDLLGYLGHEVQLAASGQEALALLERYAPDIVVTDRRMPRMSGEELIGHIRSLWPSLPIVMMTGDALAPAVERTIFAAGASAVLSKPFRAEEFERILKRVTRTSSTPQ